jgi:acyl-CoA dehydrogenase
MNYLFETELHQALRQNVRRFAQLHIAPRANDFEEAGTFPRELYPLAAEAGVLGVSYPESVGGAGGDLTHAVVVGDEMVRAGKSVGTCVGLGSHGIALPLIVRAGSPALHEAFVRKALEGKLIAALAVTEPGGGSDVAQLTTRAVRDGDDYLVTGSKTFITSGVRADFYVTAVRTGGPGHGGISVLVIPRGPGVSTSAPMPKMGWWASDTAEIQFDGVRVPAANMLGPEGGGFFLLMSNFERERVLLASQCVAIAQLAYDEALSYAKERRAFGKTLMGQQVIRHKLADMASRIAAARALTGEVATRVLAGEPCLSLVAMAKNVATDACSAVCDGAVQIFGGAGYMRGTLVERLYRDARLYPIGGGTREIMNEVIAKSEGY